ncbi:MAG: hypothetical protein ACFFG0_10465 [Candidatus Thorarchaeota archaeon]
MNIKDIDLDDLKEQSVEEMRCKDAWPVTAWCPDGCGLALVCAEENVYYCAECQKYFKLVEIEKE